MGQSFTGVSYVAQSVVWLRTHGHARGRVPAWYSTGCVSLVKHIIASRSSSGVAATSATSTMGKGREGQATQSDEPDGEVDDDGTATRRQRSPRR